MTIRSFRSHGAEIRTGLTSNVLEGPEFPPGKESPTTGRYARTRSSRRCCGTLRAQVALAHGHEWGIQDAPLSTRGSCAFSSESGICREWLRTGETQKMAKPLPLPVWDRQSGKLFSEWMDDHTPTYESEPRRSVTQWIKSQPLYDRLDAVYRNTRWSAREIEPFIRKYHIDMSEFEPVQYRSFAEFFDRRFRRGARKFPSAPEEMGAFAEARYFAWHTLAADQQFPVKGHSLSAEHILGNAERARPFIGGPVFLVRLAPVDYHRVHYCDDGITLDHDRLGRRLWTVNQHALRSKPDILFSNERSANVLDTHHFGRLGLVEIGALSVGRIVQTHPLDKPFQRGQEKSIFRFGASAIAVFGESGKWRPSEDIVNRTREGVETLVRLGETIGMRI